MKIEFLIFFLYICLLFVKKYLLEIVNAEGGVEFMYTSQENLQTPP